MTAHPSRRRFAFRAAGGLLLVRLTLFNRTARVCLGPHRLPLALYALTWGLPSSLVGLLAGLVFVCARARVAQWRGLPVVVTRRGPGHAAALGHVLVFLGGRPQALRAHEWGHASQSVLLGPLYWPIIAIPSLLHAAWYASRPRARGYLAFYTEAWAQRWADATAGPLGWDDRQDQ